MIRNQKETHMQERCKEKRKDKDKKVRIIIPSPCEVTNHDAISIFHERLFYVSHDVRMRTHVQLFVETTLRSNVISDVKTLWTF